MAKFILSAKQKEFLINIVLKDDIRIREIIASSQATTGKEKFIILLSKENADMIRDFCADALQKIGFDENYEPTDEGRLLEELIDLFYIR